MLRDVCTQSKVVLDESKVKLRDPESILRELKISWMFVKSQQQAFYKFGMLHDIVMSTCACCGIAGHERHGGLWFIWPLGENDENSIVVSGSVRTTKEMIQRQEDAVVTLDNPELNLREFKAALALMMECEKVHLEYSNLETSSGKHGHLVQMCPSEPDEKCKEIHHVWVKGSAENTGYPMYTTSKEEVVMQMRGWCDDKLVEADYTQSFLNVEVQEGKQLDFLERMLVYKKVYVDILTSGTRVMTIQDERDPCLFVNAEWGQASDWRETWNKIWNQHTLPQNIYAELIPEKKTVAA